MDAKSLAKLEQVIELYRLNHYQIIAQSDMSVTMIRPLEFSVLEFALRLLFWPLAVIYIVSYVVGKDKRVVFLRVTSSGGVEATGYTLEASWEDYRRQKRNFRMVLAIVAFFVIALLILLILRAK